MTTTDTITLPSAWASALINGDYSDLKDHADIDGYDTDEPERCHAFARALAARGGTIVGCVDDDRFTWSYRLYDAGSPATGGNVCDYTVIYKDE